MKLSLPALILAGAMLLGLAACSTAPASEDTGEQTAADLKVGLLLAGQGEDSYSQSHIQDLRIACENLGLDYDSQVFVQEEVPRDGSAVKNLQALADQGCQIVFSTDPALEEPLTVFAGRRSDIIFCQAAGFRGAQDTLDNTHDYYVKLYEAQYLAGIAAGQKTQTGLLGCVAAQDSAVVISAFTAFYLGAKSVAPEATMVVRYTGSWSDQETEAAAAQGLIDQGCDVLCHCTDTTAVAQTAQTNGVWAVGWGQDMTDAAPQAALVSTRVNWSAYYTYALECLLQNREIPQDWCGDYAGGACGLTELNQAIAAEGTAKAIQEAADGIAEDVVEVFTGPLYGIDAEGNELILAKGEFYPENQEGSLPTFTYLVDGITVLP